MNKDSPTCLNKVYPFLISLIRFAIGKSVILEPFSDTVDSRFNKWLAEQQLLGKSLTPEQLAWLAMIKDHIATSLSMAKQDFELSPFYEKGGAVKFYNNFGEKANNILEELNEVLAA